MGHHTLVNTYFLDSADSSLFSEKFWRERNAVIGQAKGRGTTLFVQNTSDSCWVLRHYRRGGLAGRILDDQFLFTGLANTRPFQEMRLLNTMCDAGLNVPTPVAAQVTQKGLIYRADLITQRIDTAVDLHHHLTEQPLPDALWQEVGRAVRKMHNLQVYHHDLNIRNIMLDAREEVWIIDFDRCDQRSGDQWKEQNLARLYRSLQKELGRCPAFYWQEANFAALREGYQQL